MNSRNTTVAAVLGAAAVAGIAAGVLLHGGVAGATSADGSTPKATGTTSSGATSSGATSPGTGPTTSAAASTPAASTTTPATGSTPTPSTPSTPRAALSEANLMVANDYVAAGFATARLHTGEGAGQAAISLCQTSSPEGQPGLKRMFSATVEGGDLYADQWVLDFREPADAQQMVSSVVEWKAACTDPGNEAMKGFTFSATPAVQVALPDGSEGQRWSMDFDQDNHQLRQLVAVVRTGTRVSVSVVSASPDLAGTVRGETLAQRSAPRLG